MSQRSIIAALLLSSCAPDSSSSTTSLSWLQANVGTARLDAEPYVYKLNDVAAEVAIAANIEALRPDVVALQEVLPDRICDALDETDAARSCAASVRADVVRQIDRLLPPSTWEVVCDPRNGYECVGVRRSVGVIVGDVVTAPPVASDQDCDDGFTVGRVDVDVDGTTVRVLNGHPQSTNAACRAAQVEQLFAFDDGSVDHVVVSGDMNLDPFGFGLNEDDVSVDVWSRHVGEGTAFAYASGPAERQPPYPTTQGLFEAVLDHVAVRGGSGVCTTLGEAPSTSPLDDDVKVMDHRALSCALELD